MDTNITKIALDTHKKQHTVAWVNCQTGETDVFTVLNTNKDITKMVKKLRKKTGTKLHFCYEAGVCGFALKRLLEKQGCMCDVIAPSLVPVKPGDRIKNDRRDAKKLLEHFMVCQLTTVYAPDIKQEAVREITRCRQAAKENLNRIRHQILKLLTRHGYRFTEGKNNWTLKHMVWLRALKFDSADLTKVFDYMLTELMHCEQRLDNLNKEVEALGDRPELKEIVGVLRCFRGVDTLTAIIIVTELFDLGRFSSPRALMAYLGLIPSEYSSGDKQCKGHITKAGNSRVRRILIESAWHSRHRICLGRALKIRRKDQPQWAIDIADKAMARLHKRYKNLNDRGKMHCKITVAVARELAGFIWAMFREYSVRQSLKVS